jgi:UDP-3-O-[3-hydroxymyristoyl] glucosamine N-acyltransferase
MAAASFVAGSTVLGDRVVLAGHVAVAGHLTIVNDVRVGGNSCILRDVPVAGDYMGHPLVEKTRWLRMMGEYRRIGDLVEEVESLRRLLGHRNGAGD